MPFLGYILPPENQKVYNNDVALALANYQKDLINASFEKMEPTEQKKLTEIVTPSTSAKPITIEDLTKLINTLSATATKAPLTVRTDGSAGPTPNQSPLETKRKKTPEEMSFDSTVSQLESELQRKLTDEEEKNIYNDIMMKSRITAEISPTFSETPSTTSSTATESLTIDDISTIDQIKKLNDVNKTAEVNKLTKKLIKELFIREIKANKNIIYGAPSNNQKKRLEENILALDDQEQLIFINKKNKPFLPDSQLSVSLKINLDLLEGKGIKGKGMSAVNGEKNFGAYHLSLPALRKGNLSIYRPKSNSVVVSRRNMSPILIKIINEIKSTMKFNLDDYDRLKVMEQKVVDHVINLLRMDYPPKMKRALDEENWNLKQRYEILLSEINAGNGGYMVVNELKDVLGKLKENKVINNRKYKLIISALE